MNAVDTTVPPHWIDRNEPLQASRGTANLAKNAELTLESDIVQRDLTLAQVDRIVGIGYLSRSNELLSSCVTGCRRAPISLKMKTTAVTLTEK